VMPDAIDRSFAIPTMSPRLPSSIPIAIPLRLN